MTLKNIPLITKISAKIIASLFFMMHMNTYALETALQVHKLDQSGAYGASVSVGDNFFKQREFNWSVSYNHFEDVKVNNLDDQSLVWDDSDNNFPLDTLDLMLSYRYYPKSYNAFIKSLTVEFQVGAGVTLTENKFTFPGNTTEFVFSEQGDVNAVLGFIIHKKLSKQMSMQVGVKHYPDYSEFGGVSSLFLGVSYQFGQKIGY